jgi:putative colanic acid biosynthesis glycosyltransferase
LSEYYSAEDVVLSLSSQETSGLTTIEGFACGTPGIVYNCTASPELITPETGLVVKKGDLNQLISSVKRLKNLAKNTSPISVG